MADFKKFGNFAKNKFNNKFDKGGFKKPFGNEGEDEDKKGLMGMLGGEGAGEENKEEMEEKNKKPGEEEKEMKGESEGEEKDEEETIEKVIELFDELTPLIEKLKSLK